MRVERRPLDALPAGIAHPRAIDVDAGGAWTAAVSGAAGQITVHRADGRRVPTTLRAKSPLLAVLPDGHVVVAASRAARGERNVVVLAPDGHEAARFAAGDDIVGLLGLPGGLVCLYGDEGISNGADAAREVVSLFNLTGALLFGYTSRSGRTSVAEVLGATWLGDGFRRLAALCYPTFELLVIDVGGAREATLRPPSSTRRACALTAVGDQLCFYSPTHGRIDCWSPGVSLATPVSAPRAVKARPLAHGRFVIQDGGGRHALIALVRSSAPAGQETRPGPRSGALPGAPGSGRPGEAGRTPRSAT